MRTEEIKIYRFEELDDRAKERARDWWREGGLDYDWWEYQYEAFETLCAFFGIEISRDRGNNKKPAIYFRGFGSQGDGSSFNGSIDVRKMFECIEQQSWKQEFQKLELRFPKITGRNQERVLKLIRTGTLHAWASIDQANRGTSVRVSMDWDTSDYPGYKDRSNIDGHLIEFEGYVQDVCDELNHHLYRSLEQEYDWLLADEQVDESIISNDYEFTEHGDIY